MTTLAEDEQRARQELALQTALANALMAARGFAAAETGTALARARELALQLDDLQALGVVTLGQITYHGARDELALSRQLAEEAQVLGRRFKDQTLCLGSEARLAVVPPRADQV